MQRLPLTGLAVLFSLLTLLSPAHATNDNFLPGDSFFPSKVLYENLQRQEQEAEPVYYYNHICELAFCGYAGYSQLKLDKQNEQLAANIRKAYLHIRKSQPIRLRPKKNAKLPQKNQGTPNLDNFYETNGLSIFFYNEDYDWQRLKIGLKYNENWREEMKKFINAGRYCAFVKKGDALKRSTTMAKQVPPLNVKIPEADIETGKKVDLPLTPTAPLKALILYDDNYQDYYDMKNGKRLLVVTNQGITRFVIYRGKWKQY